jgi:hypothetical protein
VNIRILPERPYRRPRRKLPQKEPKARYCCQTAYRVRRLPNPNGGYDLRFYLGRYRTWRCRYCRRPFPEREPA